MLTIGLSLLVCIVGGFVHLIGRDRWVELGRLAFGIGLFFVLSGAGEAVALLVR
jgi:Na+/phosphate symporter